MTPVPREELPGAPMVCIGEGPHYWTVHTSNRSVRRVSHDGGKTWEVAGIVYAGERARRDLESVEQDRIQRELK